MTKAYRHPVAIVSLFSIFILGGLLSWPLLPVELLPGLTYPTLVIRTTFGNAAPEEVETLITRPVESALGTVVGLRAMTSVSTEGLSTVTLRFDWGAKMSVAAAEVREKLDTITEGLPRDVKPPLVMHYDPSQDPIVTLALFGSADPAATRLLAEDTIKPELETIPGVATVRISGGYIPEIQVLVDRGRLAAHDLDLKNVADRIEAGNINFPGGKIQRGSLEFPVRTVGRFTTLEQLRNLPLGHGPTGGTIRLSEVAQAREGDADRTSFSRYNGKPAILLSVVKEPAANIVEVSGMVRERVSHLRRSLPEGTDLVVATDQGPFIEEALRDLRNHALFGGVLALGVLLLGLRNVRSAALIVISIPVSVLVTMGFMALAGITINFMSIGGLAIGIGMLVDASIVVLESIHRHSMQTDDLFAAVDAGLREVSGSVISGQITSVVVLVPILFMTGLAQRLFRDFAYTMGCSHLISLLTALFLLPALVVLTQRRRRHTAVAKPSFLQTGYGKVLPWSINHRGIVLAACGLALVTSLWGLGRLGFELLPSLDYNEFTMRLTLPPDASIQAVERAVDAAEGNLRQVPQVEAFVTEAGAEKRPDQVGGQKVARSNEATIVVRLRPDERPADLRDRVVSLLRAKADGVSGARWDFLLSQGFLSRALGGSENTQLLRITGDDPATLAHLGNQLAQRLQGDPHLTDVGCQGGVWTNQIQIVIDRYKASARGLSIREVAEAIQTAVEGKLVGKFIREDKETDIRVRLRPGDREKVEDLKELPLRPLSRQTADQERQSAGERFDNMPRQIPLGQVAELVSGKGPREILRTDRRRTVTVNANVVGEAFSKGEERARRLASAEQMPKGYEIEPGAERFELIGSLESLTLALLVALMLTYAVMAVQFESLRWPLVIMLTIPMTIAGPALILNLAHSPISVLVLIGGVVLIGVVVNNGILMVAYINELRSRGIPRKRAIVEGCKVRLHPILMSTGANVFGVLPVCLGWGSGAALRKTLALTVASGLTASLLFTLFLAPVLYDLASRLTPPRPGKK